nr:lysophospholipid acyltransferase family protein [Marivita sp. GX14005]
MRVAWRGGALGVVLIAGLTLMLVLRLVERPLFGMRRPITPYITQAVCRLTFVILRLPLRMEGQRMTGPGAVVANHASWLDIFALNARENVYFVSKSEVAHWPFIGWLARATGTVFIARDRREARAQARLFEDRLTQGHRLLFFPEGTSSDGLRVLPFKPTLFEAFLSGGLGQDFKIQAVTVSYDTPAASDPRFYAWWGDMAFSPHLLKVLAQKRQGAVRLTYHEPVRVREFSNRKALARHVETQVRAAHGSRASVAE